MKIYLNYFLVLGYLESFSVLAIYRQTFDQIDRMTDRVIESLSMENCWSKNTIILL